MKFDRWFSIGLFLFSSWLLYMSINIPRTAIRQTVGPEVVPIGISLLLMVASLALFFRSARLGATAGTSFTLPEGVEREDHVSQILVLLGVVAYMFLLEPLGFVVTTALFCIYEATIFERAKWVRNTIVGVIFSAAVYSLFVNFLQVMLPIGILGW